MLRIVWLACALMFFAARAGAAEGDLDAGRVHAASADADADADAKDANGDAALTAEGAAEAPAAVAPAAPPTAIAPPPASARAAASAAAPDAALFAAAAPPSVSASAAAHGAPGPAASASSADGAVVRLHERRVFSVRAAREALTAEERARRASQALEHAADEHEAPEVTVDDQGDLSIVFVGKAPVIQLGPVDAEAAGDASTAVHAASVAAAIRTALATERTRSTVANGVFAFSLLVFSGLIAFLGLRRMGEVAERTASWLEAHPDRLPVLRVGTIEVIRPAAFRGAIGVSLGAATWIARGVVIYAWLVFALSLFEATRGYSERFTGFVITPLSALLGRIGGALPLVVIAAIATVAVLVLLRFVGLFFGSVARGETTFGWLPADLAAPAGVVVRLGIVAGALLLASPLVTGSDDGALSRAGLAVLVAIGLASSPVLATVAVGAVTVFGRRLRTGDFIEIGARAGRVRAVTLLEVALEDRDGCEVRIPHLASLLEPLRNLGSRSLESVEVIIDPRASHARVREVLIEAAKKVVHAPRVALVSLDADGARYRITGARVSGDDLATTIADALTAAGVALGRNRAERAP